MATLYDSDRVRRLANVQRTFTTAVRVGDSLAFGIRGDPSFPPEYMEDRPTGVVKRVKNVGTCGASIRVKLDKSGKSIDVLPYQLDPRRIWEFTEECFPNVVKRSQPDAYDSSEPVDSHTYGRQSSNVPYSEYQALLQKVEILQSRLEKSEEDNASFNGAMVASITEMADEVRNGRDPKSAPFCHKFTETYKSYLHSEPSGPREAVFASDFDSASD